MKTIYIVIAILFILVISLLVIYELHVETQTPNQQVKQQSSGSNAFNLN